MEDKENRQDYIDCVKWLTAGDDIGLIKRTITKKNLTEKARNSYIEVLCFFTISL